MAAEQPTLMAKAKNFLEELFALKISEAERGAWANDPYNLFESEVLEGKPLRVAAALAILFHILLFIIAFPSFGNRVLIVTQDVLVLKQLARPATLAGGGNMPEAAPPKPILVPIPDPTPNLPEPIRKKEIEEIPRIQEEIALDLNIGEITAPPGPPARGGPGREPLSGAGPGTGDGGVYTIGSGVTMPQILQQTVPTYTDDAIRAKVQGLALIQMVVRKNGRVDSFKVLKGLGYGLEEKAIQEMAANWKFRPGTLQGRPVDVMATIEVSFNLR